MLAYPFNNLLGSFPIKSATESGIEGAGTFIQKNLNDGLLGAGDGAMIEDGSSG